ncbi:MAG: MBL fold metallo-hydrolase, partial [Oscillospiraceae bacterium]
MNKLIVLGTGNAMVTRCYNTCFALECGEEIFLVDAGGGNGILGILDRAGIDAARIHHIFVTHAHTDHILGMPWMLRKIGTLILSGAYEGNLTIHCHDQSAEAIQTIAALTIQGK